MNTKIIFKTVALAMMMPAMLLTTACSNEDDLVNNTANTENTINKGYALPVTVNVTREGDAGTRATYTDNGDGSGSLGFSAGDKLFVEGSHVEADRFAGTLDYVPATGKFSGTIYTESPYGGTIDDLLDGKYATLLPAGYESTGYLDIMDEGCEAHLGEIASNSFATSKKLAVEQLSFETGEYTSGTGFTLNPCNAILNFTVTGFVPNTEVTASLSDGSSLFNIEGDVTTNGSGNATFAMGVFGTRDLNELSLTVAGNPVTLVNSSTELTAGKIYNITRAVTPPTLAQTMNTAGMDVKVKYYYDNDYEENYCLFRSNGDRTYTFQSGYGSAGGDEGYAKALVVEDDKLVFKQNYYNTIENGWSDAGFSVTFDTSNNTYSRWFGPEVQDLLDYTPSFISMEVNSVPIALTQKITVSDLVKEENQSWNDIASNTNNSGKIYIDDFDYVRRCSDGAKLLQRDPDEEDWSEVNYNMSYYEDYIYKFEGD